MKKLVFLGDSLTDMGRNREMNFSPDSYGSGFVFYIEGELASKYPHEYTIYNRGIGGNKSVDIYARIKTDCWNLQPDILTCFFGINDLAFDIKLNSGVEIERYKRLYETMIEETLARFPNIRIILMEPMMLKGVETQGYYDEFLQIRDYAKAVRELAEKYHCLFVPLQDTFDELANQDGAEYWLFDGIHPTVVGSKVIAEKWLEYFDVIRR